MMQVRVTVNERGALRNGRFAFADRFTLVTELLQNCRRAGATRILVTHDPVAGMLIVEDDGSGIADFHKLLAFNESGWNEALQQQEHAFGVGFSKVLYAAKRCVVQSRGLSMSFNTDEALDQKLIDVVDDPGVHPFLTRIVLDGVDLPDLAATMPSLIRGFALPVEFNGSELPRPHSEDALRFSDTPIGRVHLHGRETGEDASGTYVYLQGFCVSKPCFDPRTCVHVVHLDSRQFVARLPDRRSLIDEDEQLRKVSQAQRDLWRVFLLKAKQSMPAESFCERYWDIARGWQAGDVFDDVPFLPSKLCGRILNYPVQFASGEGSVLNDVDRPVSQSEVESGAVQLVDLSGPCDESMAKWMLASRLNWVVVQAHQLSERHWVQAHVREMDDQEISVSAIGIGPVVTFEGRWIWVNVQLCERVVLTMGADVVEITDEAVWDGKTIYFPSAEASGAVAQQVSDYVDSNDQFLSDDLEADTAALATLIARVRYTDPKAALMSCLRDIKFENFPLICDRQYSIRIDSAGRVESVDLVDPVGPVDPAAATVTV